MDTFGVPAEAAESQPGITSRPRHNAAACRVTLFISNLTRAGGAETQSVELARSLKSRGWDVSVLSMRTPGGRTREAHEDTAPRAILEAEGIPVHTLATGSSWNLVTPLARLTRFLREQQPHILHCHMTHAVLTARIARVLNRIPVVIGTLHGLKMYNVQGTGWRLREMANGLTDWLSDTTTVVCHAAADHYLSSRAISHNAIRLIPNGVDTERFRFDPWLRSKIRTELKIAGEFVWLLAARFQPVKDHHGMLRAFARVAAQSPHSTLLLAGSGPLEIELKELAEGLGIGARVRFLGARNDMPGLMNAADACVLSSVYEALPMALLEAAASGLPAVTTDVGGTSEVVVHGLTGFLAPPSNPEALASAMLRLEALPGTSRARMGEQARRHVTSRFGLNEVVGYWEGLYQEMLVKKEVRL